MFFGKHSAKTAYSNTSWRGSMGGLSVLQVRGFKPYLAGIGCIMMIETSGVSVLYLSINNIELDQRFDRFLEILFIKLDCFLTSLYASESVSNITLEYDIHMFC